MPEELHKTEEQLAEYAGEDKIISSLEMKEFIKQQSYQEVKVASLLPTLDRLIDGFVGGELIVISGRTKEGKCFGKGTEILMHNGTIKKVEDIKVGDKIMGDDSTERNISALGHGQEMMYKITNRDGSSFACNESHILALKRTRSAKWRYDNKEKEKRPRKDRKGEVKNITVGEYVKSSPKMKHLYKMYKVKVDFNKTKLPVDPYFLGLWLGDGSSNNTGITTADKEIENYLYGYARKLKMKITVNKLKENKSNTYSIVREKRFSPVGKRDKSGYGGLKPLQLYLKELNVVKNKHIPFDYKINSERNRLKLLAGLIDSDGCKNKNYSIQFTNKNKRLRDDFMFLCRSLGFYVSAKSPKIVNGQEYWVVYISGDLQKIPLLLKRKMPETKGLKNILTQCFKVKKTGIGDYYGFEIDGNRLFLLADFTVVHNTLLSQTLTVNFLEQDVKSVWFSYEMPPRQFLKCFPELPLFYLPQRLQERTIDWVEKRIWEAKIKYGVRVVFIDHMHYLLDLERTRNPSLDIGVLVRRLKLLALKHNIIIFLLWHLTKIKKGEIPRKEDARDSSFASQESDTFLMIYRLEEENQAVISVEDARRTGVLDKKLRIQKISGLLREVSYDEVDRKGTALD